MADFCAACAPEIFAGAAPPAELARRNDFVGWLGDDEPPRGVWAWGLCENCGSHLFDNAGFRRCGDAPQGNVFEPCLGCQALTSAGA